MKEPGSRRRKWKDALLSLLFPAVCPLCGNKVYESPRAFNCMSGTCRFTLWKDCLNRGGGPEITQKLLLLLLERKTLTGSTGVIRLLPDTIDFTPNGAAAPSCTAPITYQKRK